MLISGQIMILGQVLYQFKNIVLSNYNIYYYYFDIISTISIIYIKIIYSIFMSYNTFIFMMFPWYKPIAYIRVYV